MAGGTGLGISIFVAGMYGAWLLPLKMALTIFLPLWAIYGLGVVVFEYGGLSWTKIHAFQPASTGGGLLWFVAPLTVTFLTGLTVDYDLFLFARQLDYRRQGWSDRASVVRALQASGPVICSSGVIMALAFLPLLFASSAPMIQVGFVCSAAVLLDTFFTRSVVVPSVLACYPVLNYWPNKMPDPVFEVEDIPDLSGPEDPGPLRGLCQRFCLPDFSRSKQLATRYHSEPEPSKQANPNSHGAKTQKRRYDIT